MHRSALTALTALAAAGTLVAGFALCGCGEPPPAAQQAGSQLSPTARPQIVEALRADLAAPRHRADGAGRAWLHCPAGELTCTARAGEAGRWEVVFEAGEPGIAEGGWLFLQVSPYWGWSPPQLVDPQRLGYTTVTTEAEGVQLRPAVVDQGLVGVEVAGRALAAGEQVRFVYGAGALGAVADRYAESGSPLWVAVDGDGDGVRALVEPPPAVDVEAGPPAQLVLTLPSTARPGDEVELAVAVLDRFGNAGVAAAGRLELAASDAGLELPQELLLEGGEDGVVRLPVTVRGAGVHRVLARGKGTLAELEAVSNPLLAAEHVPTILWADLHGHSRFSDGSATPEEYFRYARDVSALDAVALTDHDHWGMEPLAQHPELWQEIRHQVEAFHQPGRFVTLLGYEWTSWLYGHRHVLYFDDQGEVLSSVDPAYETPQQLWAALRGKPALTVAHHSAGGPIATDWSIPPDPELEPVTEVVSVHGASEAPDAPAAIYSPVPGNFVRDALDRGYRLGFVGSGDSHDGHPGLAHLGAPSGGLAALFTAERTRAGVLEALRARRAYATSGPRILLITALAGHPMGNEIPQAEIAGEAEELSITVIATAPLERLDVVRSGQLVESVDGGGELSLGASPALAGLTAGEYVYVRAVQADGAAAWSSPYFIVE